MAVDPDLASEGCIFMNPGNPHFWLSDDLQHVAPAPAGVATPGVKNDIQVVVHHKANCALPDNAVAVKVDLWVCAPTASAINTISGQTKRIQDANPASPGAIGTAASPRNGLRSPICSSASRPTGASAPASVEYTSNASPRSNQAAP